MLKFSLMFYLELQHRPSYVGVEERTVGSYTGAGITRIFSRDLYRERSPHETHSSAVSSQHSVVVTVKLTALCVAACCKLWVMNWELMRRHGSSFTREFIRATRAASLRASAWVSHTWGRGEDEESRCQEQEGGEPMWNLVTSNRNVRPQWAHTLTLWWFHTSLQLIMGSEVRPMRSGH